MSSEPTSPRRRLPGNERRALLLEVARELIREEGTDALTLARVAERAGVAKPLVYRHFGDRSGLLAELFRVFDERQHAVLDAALLNAPAQLDGMAATVARSYLDCSATEGAEMSGIIDALSGSPVLDELRRDSVHTYIGKCGAALASFTPAGSVPEGDLLAVVGAGDALARAVASGTTTAPAARETLTRVILAITQ